MPRVEDLAEKRATAGSKDSFLEDLGVAAVLIRLDERGGKDEPADWAFHGIPKSVSFPPRDDDELDIGALRKHLGEREAKSQSSKKSTAAKAKDSKKKAEGKASFDAPPLITADDDDTDSGQHPWVSPDDETLTAGPPATLSMPLPPARGAATVYLAGCGEDACVIGRDARAQVAIDERSISKMHARLRLRDGHFGVVDLESSNGTKVNGRALEVRAEGRLKNGDVLTLGDVELLFLDADMLFERLPDLTD